MPEDHELLRAEARPSTKGIEGDSERSPGTRCEIRCGMENIGPFPARRRQRAAVELSCERRATAASTCGESMFNEQPQ